MSSYPNDPKIYLLPNLMTAGNLGCGFFAVLTIFKGMQAPDFDAAHGYYLQALLLIFGSCLFDLLDGRLARLGGQDSPFGREFDSLADVVSFGMAPALLVSKAVLFNLEIPGASEELRDGVGWSIGFLFLLCGAIRLARFNCIAAAAEAGEASAEQDLSSFRGIPIPMAAGFIASLTFLIIHFRHSEKLGAWSYVLVLVMIGLSFLMVSNVRYPSFKKINLKTKASLPVLLIVAFAIAGLVYFYWILPAVLFSLYLVYGLVRPWLSAKWRNGVEDFEVEE